MKSYLNYSVVAPFDISFEQNLTSVDSDVFKECDFAITSFGKMSGLSIILDTTAQNVTKNVTSIQVNDSGASFFVSDTPETPVFLNLDTSITKQSFHPKFQSVVSSTDLVCGAIFQSMVRILFQDSVNPDDYDFTQSMSEKTIRFFLKTQLKILWKI